MSKRTKPFYIWFSFLALAAFCWDTSRRIKLSSPSFWDRFDLWNKAVFNIWKIFILYIIAPIVLISILTSYIIDNATSRLFFSQFIVVALLVFIYLCGVYATYKHILWRERNIPHLLNRPVPSIGASDAKDESEQREQLTSPPKSRKDG